MTKRELNNQIEWEEINTGGGCKALVAGGTLCHVVLTDIDGCDLPTDSEPVLLAVYFGPVSGADGHGENLDLPIISMIFGSKQMALNAISHDPCLIGGVKK